MFVLAVVGRLNTIDPGLGNVVGCAGEVCSPFALAESLTITPSPAVHSTETAIFPFILPPKLTRPFNTKKKTKYN